MKYATIFTVMFVLNACSNGQEERASTLLAEASTALEEQEYAASIAAAAQALAEYDVLKDTLGMIESHYLLARASALSGDFANAVVHGEGGSILCKQFTAYPLEYPINNTLSWAYFELGRGFDETRAHQERQLFVVDQLDDAAAKAMVYNNYGYDLTVSGTGPIREAIGHMQFANDYYAQAENHNGRWYTLMNLTWQYRLINDLDSSAYYGELAVQQAQADEDRHAIIEANTNLGETLLAQGKIQAARAAYESALAISGQENDRDKYVFDVYYSRFLWKTGERDRAITLVSDAIAFLENSEIFYEMLGRAYLAGYLVETGALERAAEQIAIFSNPRAGYISQEAKVLAGIAEVKMLARSDRQRANARLRSLIVQVNLSGAEYLEAQLDGLVIGDG